MHKMLEMKGNMLQAAILILLCFTVNGTMASEINNQTTDCSLRSLIPLTVDSCFNDFNRDLEVKDNVTTGSTCIVVCPKSGIKTWKQCLNGKWIGEREDCENLARYSNAGKKRKRVKRGWWRRMWRKVGNFFKGVVRFTTCIFTLFIPRGCRGGPPRDSTRPSLKCPPDIIRNADPRQIHTRVFWAEPVANDDRDGRITPTRHGRAPGSTFQEGNTNIRYHARDRSGNMATCSFNIRVKVIRCPTLKRINNGYYQCVPTHDMLRSTTCSFNCYRGYQLAGASTLMCTDSGIWNSAQPLCEKITCPVLPPSLPSRRYICTDNNKFGSICSYTCPVGYDIEPGMSRVRVCEASQTWRGDIPRCKDVTPPKMSECKPVWYGYTHRNSSKGTMIWKEPTVSDNKDASIFPVRISGPSVGSLLPAGTHNVVYGAVDKAGNQATVCKMKLIMRVIICPKIVATPYMTITCPTGRRYGSVCEFKCDNGTLLNGTDTTVCNKSPTGVNGYWSFGKKQPYCEVLQRCAVNLNVPKNGALACDYWLGGTFCQMQCKKGYDIPPGQPFYQMIVCGGTGKWMPSSHLPDCARRSGTRFVRIPMSTFYYFDGDCHDPAVIDNIKSNFIQALTKSAYRDACLVYAGNCKVSKVQVKCGVTSRKRSTGVRIDFYLELELEEDVSPTGMTNLKSETTNITSVIQKDLQTSYVPLIMATNSTLHVLEINSGNMELVCPDMTMPSDVTSSCVTCVEGSYYDAENKTCPQCPKGEYQPLESQTSCLKCPDDMTTRHTGSVDEEMCEDPCVPGSWSPDGVFPCSSCDIGTYQMNYGADFCHICPGSKTTLSEGSVFLHECQDFDISLTENGTATVRLIESISTEKDILSFSLQVWFKVNKIENADILRLVENENDTMSLLSINEQLLVEDKRSIIDTGISIHETRWLYLVLKIDEQNMTISVDEQEVQLNVTISTNIRNITGIIFGGAGFQGSVSQINIWSKERSPDDMLTRTCFSDNVADIFNWKMAENAHLDNAFIQLKSECDDFNNCEPNPCNNGTCSDELDSYTCSCNAGYSGPSCTVNIDDCLNNICENNSTCIDDVMSYRCLCSDGFTGELCEIKVVHGQWSAWGDWSMCSSTCNNGTKERSRLCNSPSPSNGGHDCEGKPITYATCFEKECPVCDDLKAPVNGTRTCMNDTDSHTINCTVNCNDGFDFDHAPKDFYECGPETFYLWDFQTDDNPYRRLPNCVLHGQWSIWGDWSMCSSSCNIGTKERSRLCNSPSPSNGGNDCEGKAIMYSTCFEKECPAIITSEMINNMCLQPLMKLIKWFRHWFPTVYYHYYWKLREITKDRCIITDD